MKYLITESKLERAVINYINELFPEDNLHLQYMMDDDGEIEAMKVYLGNSDDDLMCFAWYGAEYFHGRTSYREKSPMVMIDNEFSFSLNAYFGDSWHEPFKRWFTEYFNLPVKTVE